MTNGFTDANGKQVKEGDDVRYRLADRPGRLEFCGHDGSAIVFFYDTQQTEDVNWCHLCKDQKQEA